MLQISPVKHDTRIKHKILFVILNAIILYSIWFIRLDSIIINLIISFIFLNLTFRLFIKRSLISIFLNLVSLIFILNTFGYITTLLLLAIPNYSIITFEYYLLDNILMFTISFVLTSTLLTCINLLTSKKKINEKWFQINLNIIALFLIVIATTNSSIAITKVLEDDRFQIPKPPLIMFNILFIVIGVVTLITINISFFKKKKYDVIERKSKLDLMTGMFNHASGKEELVTVIAKSKNINQIITLCYIDINKLKYVNDNFGHSKGDKVILTVTNVIKDNLRRNDLVIRLGGDEILLALVGCDYNDSESIVRRMQIELAEFTGNSYTISFSYGLREVSPSEDTDLEKAIIEADNMMYAQKSG